MELSQSGINFTPVHWFQRVQYNQTPLGDNGLTYYTINTYDINQD